MKRYLSFQWHITDECDQRCKHCYIFSEDERKKPDAMTWEQMQDVVDNCCDMCEMYDHLPYFYLTGGDPILPTGDVFACRRVQDSKVGNVFEDRLADVWVCEMEAYRDYRAFKKCSRCELLAWCRGCPAVAGGAHGDFYGAPSVCVVFAQKDFLYSVPDAFCCAENMVLMAEELGISSCIAARGEETSDSEAGAALLREWGVPDHYIARCFVLLGYVDGDHPGGKPRKAGRYKIVEG